jgi:hypothetical protein
MALSERVAHERLTSVCFVDYAREMLVQIGRDEHLSRIVATIAADNRAMQQVARPVRLALRDDEADRLMKAELSL